TKSALGHALLKTVLSKQSGLLIANHARNGCSIRNSLDSSCGTEDVIALMNAWQNGFGNFKDLQKILVPSHSFNIHQLSATGIGHIGFMSVPIGQFPKKKAVDGSHQEAILFDQFFRLFDVF